MTNRFNHYLSIIEYCLIKNSSIYVQIGPDYFYGPSFFPKQTETNNPKITRKSFTGFDLNLAIQNSVIEVAIAHLIGNLGVIKLAYIFDVIGEFSLDVWNQVYFKNLFISLPNFISEGVYQYGFN